MLSHFGTIKTVDPVVSLSWDETLAAEAAAGDQSPHGRPWHVSFHASAFPGMDKQACPRKACYELMDVGREINTERWLNQTAEVGKAIELAQVRRLRDAGRLARSNIPGLSTDPDARDEQGNPMPQIGFIDKEHWLTGSVDIAMTVFNNDNKPHIVEVKTKHESQIVDMMNGLRGPDEKHEKQARCSLGMANANPGAFLHPTEDRVLDVPTDGTIYYIARDSKWQPGNTEVLNHEFLIEHNDEFMEHGLDHLKGFKQAFLDDELVQTVERKSARSHPLGWMWSKGACERCSLKKICKADYENNTTVLSESSAYEIAKSIRTSYDPVKTREVVLNFWDMIPDEALIPDNKVKGE